MIQQFINQCWTNGSGNSNVSNYGLLQEYTTCGAPSGGKNNYFVQVNQITPGCSSPNNYLSGITVAVDVFSQGHPLSCGDSVLDVGQGGGVGTVKSVTDSCPACNGIAQIDDYNTSTACSLGGNANYVTIRINR
jgi:hypothetical protein